ncbi:MAG: DUF5689 domain-containing protein [Bacteroidales bacterium]|nr:DUF5689 domain-containing protein [Bacteroidales bacterium]
MKRIYILFIAAVLITPFFMTSCDEELDTPPIATVDQSKVLTIADIYKIKADSSFEYMFKDDYMLYATVTMDDYEGNIYKEAYVEDASGGINIYRLSYAESFKVGQYVRINLNRARVVDYSGKLELVFDSVLNTNKSIVVQHANNPIIPEQVTIADIETGNYKCKLVEVQGIQFANSELNETYFGNVTFTADNRLVEDSTKTIVVRTSKYADFAKDTVPQGSGKMVAIVTLHSSGWQLLVRSIDEVDMNEPRF